MPHEPVLTNQKIPHAPESVRDMAGRLPKQTRYVMESSSVWIGTYRLMTEEMKLDVTLSNPRTTLLIAKSKKKTDKVDAVVLWRTCTAAATSHPAMSVDTMCCRYSGDSLDKAIMFRSAC